MIDTHFITGTVIAVCLIFTGCKTTGMTTQPGPSNPPVTHDLVIKKVGNIWKVVDSATNSTKVEVAPNDKITWVCNDSDVVFQFPPRNNRFFAPQSKADTLRRGFTKELKAGQKLRLNVRSQAPTGRVVYAVYVKKTGDFAEGGSAPVIIIIDQM